MDYDLMLRMSALVPPGAFHQTRRPLGCFRVYAGQKTGSAQTNVAREHRLIAEHWGTTWKYGPAGQLMRQFFRGKRVAEYLWRGRIEYLWSRLATRMQIP
jgi:hypothetical protein